MPRQKGDSQYYIITTMLNGLFRAECHKPDCHWWQDFEDPDEANVQMKQHRKSHRKSKTPRPSQTQEEN